MGAQCFLGEPGLAWRQEAAQGFAAEREALDLAKFFVEMVIV